MLLTVSLIFFSIMFLLSFNGMASTPVSIYEGMLNPSVLEPKRIVKLAYSMTVFFFIFQSIPALLHHFIVEPLPLYIFIAVLIHASVNIHDLVDRGKILRLSEEEIITDARDTALEFAYTKWGKIKYYGVYATFNLVRLIVVIGLINIIFF